mgnify:FL=1
MKKSPLNVFIVPTGVGASIGGYAGDASGAARMFSKIGKLIVNPNVVNAAVFSGIDDNMLYTEGYIIDEFFKGNIALRESKNNKIGVIFDKSIPEYVLNIHINTINAVKTVYGIDIFDYEITEEPAGVEFFVNENGISSGTVKNAATLINAGNNLKNKGAQALGVVCLFDNSDDEAYENADGVDPVGGVEGIISHIISRELKLPCAHAPAFSDISIPTRIVSEKAAAEYITPTFLPCILLGLNNAPQIVSFDEKQDSDYCIDDVNSLIIPFNSLGSIPVLQAAERGIKIFAVKENSTILDVNAASLGLDVMEVETYKDVLKSL